MYTRQGLESRRAASATPTEYESPVPSEPPQNSTPGHFRSGWPWSLLPNALSVSISDSAKYPATAMFENSPGAACPFERTSRSLSSHCGLRGSYRMCL